MIKGIKILFLLNGVEAVTRRCPKFTDPMLGMYATELVKLQCRR